MKPKISIIIVNFNGKKYIRDCLSSVLANKYPNFEIIVVDNGSTDNSVRIVREFIIQNTKDKIHLIENQINLGFAGGNNLGFKEAAGDYILLLNNDTKIEKNFLEKLLPAFDEIPNLGCVQPKIVLMKDTTLIDACGAFLTSSLFLYHYGYDKKENLSCYNKPFKIFSTKGACMLFKKELAEKIGLFDSGFWCYYEETDFCHRVWLTGYECWYYPKAVVQHLLGGTSTSFNNDFIQYQNFKNRLTSYLKNFEVGTLFKHLPLYFLVNILLSFYWLLQGKVRHFLSLYQAIWWNFTNFGSTVKKRQAVQKLRTKSDKEILKEILLNPRLGYYYYLFNGLSNYEDQPIK